MLATPILKWAGGKGRLLAQYEPYLPTHFKRYFEPFAGGAALFFWLRSRRGGKFPGTLNDSNEELINCYQVVQQQPDPLLLRLRELAEQHGTEFYYQVRAQQPQDSVERAARLIYLNKTCYNGLYRVNAKGGFNVPIGRYKDPSIVQEEKIRAAHLALQGTNLWNKGFDEAALAARKGDFVYFDPPYQPLTPTSNFTSYTKDQFGMEQQCHLAEIFKQLVKRGCHVLLSNSASDLVRNLYRDYQQVEIQAPRFINSKSAGRSSIAELLILASPAEPEPASQE
ncbi:DNA adenine methylase [bacterium]|nr:DNA adenine methylase [bacterium]